MKACFCVIDFENEKVASLFCSGDNVKSDIEVIKSFVGKLGVTGDRIRIAYQADGDVKVEPVEPGKKTGGKNRSHSANKYKGVRLQKNGKWMVQVTYKGEYWYGGMYKTEEEAHRVAEEYRAKKNSRASNSRASNS